MPGKTICCSLNKKFLVWLFGTILVILFQVIADMILRTILVTAVSLVMLFCVENLVREYRALERAEGLDELTGAGNFRAFMERLRIEIERTKRQHSSLSLVLIDLDQFKRYNDSFGHRRGNELLSESGRLLLEVVRTADGVYRFGGDEFAVVLPDADINEARRIALRIRTAFEQLSMRDMVTLSMGLADYRGETLEEFFDRADKMLYEVKGKGGDRCLSECERLNSKYGPPFNCEWDEMP